MKLAILALSILSSTAIITPAVAAETVSLPAFRDVGLSGSGEVNIIRGPRNQVVIREGSSAVSTFRVKDNGLEIRTCHWRCPNDYRLVVDVYTPQVGDVALSGSGRIRVGAGFASASHRALAINGSGEIDASSLSANQIEVAINGSGDIQTGQSRKLDAAISGSGSIRYSGNPDVQSAISGSGVIRARR